MGSLNLLYTIEMNLATLKLTYLKLLGVLSVHHSMKPPYMASVVHGIRTTPIGASGKASG